jgi:hypothetical protein
MQRDAIREWRRAVGRWESPQALAFTRPLETRAQEPAAIASPERWLDPRQLRRMRPIAEVYGPGRLRGDRDDLTRAIRLLQRHNKQLRARFGIGWALATSLVLGEATRRSMPCALLARALAAGLPPEGAAS